MRQAAEKYSIEVLITNIPFATEDSDNLSKRMTADPVIGRYLSQAVIEKRFRTMKTCHGLTPVFFHTPAIGMR